MLLIETYKRPLSITTLAMKRAKMSKERKHKSLPDDFDESREFSKDITVDYIKSLKDSNKELIDTLNEDRKFMRQEFQNERDANFLKFQNIFIEVKEIKTENKLFKWVFMALGTAVILGIVDKLFNLGG